MNVLNIFNSILKMAVFIITLQIVIKANCFHLGKKKGIKNKLLNT